VPAVLRAGRRLGRRGPADPRRQGRRRLGDQRPEGLDHRGALLRLRHSAGPHRSRRAQAQGPDHVLDRHEGRRRRMPADPSDVGRPRVQRGLFHRPAGQGQPAPGRGRRRLEGGARHPDERASGGRRLVRPQLPRDHGPGPRPDRLHRPGPQGQRLPREAGRLVCAVRGAEVHPLPHHDRPVAGPDARTGKLDRQDHRRQPDAGTGQYGGRDAGPVRHPERSRGRLVRGRLPAKPDVGAGPADRRRHRRDPQEHHRRAGAGPARRRAGRQGRGLQGHAAGPREGSTRLDKSPPSDPEAGFFASIARRENRRRRGRGAPDAADRPPACAACRKMQLGRSPRRLIGRPSTSSQSAVPAGSSAALRHASTRPLRGARGPETHAWKGRRPRLAGHPGRAARSCARQTAKALRTRIRLQRESLA